MFPKARFSAKRTGKKRPRRDGPDEPPAEGEGEGDDGSDGGDDGVASDSDPGGTPPPEPDPPNADVEMEDVEEEDGEQLVIHEAADDDATRAEVEAERAEFEELSEGATVNFYVHIQGGPAAKRRHGVSANAVAGFARRGVPRDWAGVYQYPKQREFSFRKYSKKCAHELAREWCRRADWFFKKWLRKTSRTETFEYVASDVTEYAESEAYAAFVHELELDKPDESTTAPQRRNARNAVDELRALQPHLGPV